MPVGGYAPDGDLLAASDSVNGNWSYGYDALNRLATADCTAGAAPCPGQAAGVNLGLQWSYDRYGNRWTQAVTAGAAPAPSAAFSGGNNRLDGWSYDANGNLLSDGTHSYSYDAGNRLITVDGGQTASYQYDAEGRRQRRQANGSTWDTLFDLDGTAGTVLLWAPSGAYSGWARSEIYVPGRHLATYRDGTTYFAHPDPLGTERLRSKPDGSLYETCVSLPFGDGQNCSFPNGAATDSPLHFTGKPRDEETGLDYFGARLYSSSLGRFLSPDWSAQAEPVPYAKLDNPQSLNLYAYVLNNPVSRTDPDGHVDCSGKNATGIGCRMIASWKAGSRSIKSAAESAKQWSAAHPKAVKTTMTAVMVATALSGALDGGASEAALPEEAAAETALTEGSAEAGEASSAEASDGIIGNNPRQGSGRINTDMPGGHSAAQEQFGKLTEGQDVGPHPMAGHPTASDGTMLRLNPDGTARIDRPASVTGSQHETIHFNDPDE